MTDIPVADTPRLPRPLSLRPLVLPALALVPLRSGDALGRIAPGAPRHPHYGEILQRCVAEDFARLLTPPPVPP